MLTLLLLLAETSTSSDAGMYTVIGGAGALNAGVLIGIYKAFTKAVTEERNARSAKFDQLYSHINANFAKRETIEVHLAALKQSAQDQTSLLRAFIDSQATLAQQQGRLETKLDMMQRSQT